MRAVGQQLWGRAQWAGPESALLCLGWGGRGAGSHGATISQLLAASSGTAGAQLVCVQEGRASLALVPVVVVCSRGRICCDAAPVPSPGCDVPPKLWQQYPHVSSTLGYVGNQGRLLLVPTCPRTPVGSCTHFPQHLQPCLLAGASLAIPCSLLNPLIVLSAGALCLCVHIAGLDLLWDSGGGGMLRFLCCCSPVLL